MILIPMSLIKKTNHSKQIQNINFKLRERGYVRGERRAEEGVLGEGLEGEPAEGREEDADLRMLGIGRTVIDVHGYPKNHDVDDHEGGDQP